MRAPRRFGLLLTLVVAGCAESAIGPTGPAPIPVEDELIARMPSGAELLVEVDVQQLRAWPMLERLRAELPAGVTEPLGRLATLGLDPLTDVDRAALALLSTEPGVAELTVIGEGRFDVTRVREALAAPDGAPSVASGQAIGVAAQDSGASVEDYHGRRLLVGAHGVWAPLGDGVAGFGSHIEARRAVDVALGGEPGLSRSPSASDQQLVAALHRAPSARDGRAALRGALLVGPAWRDRAAAAGAPRERLADLDWISAALAIGDGVDLGIVAGTRDAAAATRLSAAVKARLDELHTHRVLALVGLTPFLDDVKLASRGSEAHLAFRLGGRQLARFCERVVRLVALAARSKP